jgi:hypothetical protein
MNSILFISKLTFEVNSFFIVINSLLCNFNFIIIITYKNILKLLYKKYKKYKKYIKY